MEIDSASDHEGGGDLLDQFDDGFATSGVGDDAIPTYDLESLVELNVAEGNSNAEHPAVKAGGFQKTVASPEAAKVRAKS